MKRFKFLIVLLYFAFTPSVYSQNPTEIDKIRVSFKKYLNGFYPVKDGVSHRNYQGKEIKGDIDGLLDFDVLKYYKLDRKYDSPLKRKMFTQSKEYQTLLTQMEKERKFLLADTFYIVSKIEKTNYDLKEKAFFFPESTNSIVYNDIGIVTSLLTDRGVKIEIENEKVALEVENSYQDCRLLYIFTFDEELSRNYRDFLVGRMRKILLVNIKNGKVYFYKAKKRNLVQYDHDIYAESENDKGEDFPVKHFLKVGNKMIELDVEDIGEDYKLEIENNKYYAIGIDGKRYLLNFKPERVILYEKEEAYVAKCEEIAKDYKLHPENYEDVTIVTDNVMHSYVDKTGFEWVYETEGLYYYNLEAEGVYMIFDELKFVRRKADSR